MAEIIEFKKKPHDKKNIMCKNGFHKWQIVKEKKFDVKFGKLSTLYRCMRCKVVKTEWT